MNTVANIEQLIEINEFFYKKNDVVNQHCCLWGDFNFSLNGTLELRIGQQSYLSPPSYGLWIPPRLEHCCSALEAATTHYVCIRIHPSVSAVLPHNVKTLSIRPFLRYAVEEALQQQRIGRPHLNYYQHLLQLILDQIRLSPAYDYYLPQSNHPILAIILQRLADPALFMKSLAQIFAAFDLSERHILRLCQQELNMPISEWRNRAKIIYAISQLQQGLSIKSIGYALGYQHSSSFIEFFKRYTGQTPAQLRDIEQRNLS